MKHAGQRNLPCIQTVEKASLSFLRKQKRKSQNIFCQGVYLTENTSQAASVEFVRHRRTNYARSRLQKIWRKAPKGIFDMLHAGQRNLPCIAYLYACCCMR